MKKIIPVELYIRDLYRVYVECDENTTNDEAAALARQMALCGDVDQTMLSADQEIEYDDISIAFVDDEAAWTEEEEQEMKAALSEAYAAQEQREQQEKENSITITATVDGVAREVVLTPMQIYKAHRTLQDVYDLEDVNSFLDEWLEDTVDSFHEQQARGAAEELADRYRDCLDNDNHWFDILQDVIGRFLDEHADDTPDE